MKLNSDQMKKLIEQLSNKWPEPRNCPVCHSNNWNVGDAIFEMREFQGGGLVLGPKQSLIPLINVTCVACGNTLTFNAIILGLVEPKKEGGANE
jgi:hypothetical protein